MLAKNTKPFQFSETLSKNFSFSRDSLCSLEPNWLAIEASRLYRNERQVWIIEWKEKKGFVLFDWGESFGKFSTNFFSVDKNPEKLKCHQKKGRFKQYFLYFYIAGMLDNGHIYETKLNCLLPEKVIVYWSSTWHM